MGLATSVEVEIMNSSSYPTSRDNNAVCNASVPLAQPKPFLIPRCSERLLLKFFASGPLVNLADKIASSTSLLSPWYFLFRPAIWIFIYSQIIFYSPMCN